MIPIRLNSEDLRWATKVAEIRWKYTQEHNSKARFEGARKEQHVLGTGAELAFCRALGLTWPATTHSFHDIPDVPPFWEVRGLRPNRQLNGVKVIKDDADYSLNVWVRCEPGLFTIMGYIRAGGAKQHPEWYGDPYGKKAPLWLVPESRMAPINHGFHDAHQYLRARSETVLLRNKTFGTRWVPDENAGWICAICGSAEGASA